MWPLLGVFITYVALIDLGISGATAKFIVGLFPAEDIGRIGFTSFGNGLRVFAA